MDVKPRKPPARSAVWHRRCCCGPRPRRRRPQTSARRPLRGWMSARASPALGALVPRTGVAGIRQDRIAPALVKVIGDRALVAPRADPLPARAALRWSPRTVVGTRGGLGEGPPRLTACQRRAAEFARPLAGRRSCAAEAGARCESPGTSWSRGKPGVCVRSRRKGSCSGTPAGRSGAARGTTARGHPPSGTPPRHRGGHGRPESGAGRGSSARRLRSDGCRR